MEVEVLYFAGLTDIIGTTRETYKLDSSSLLDLLNLITRKHSKIKSLIWDQSLNTIRKSITFALNHEIIKSNDPLSTELKSGDIIAILLPFSGG